MTESRFSCFLVGADTLLMECGNILIEQGHDILGVVTSESRISDWCARHSLPVVDAHDDYASALAKQPFDYLFTITHLSIVPEKVLALPSKLAINFHDGPLPRYAGLNAPVWALINQEEKHGITWHMLTSGVDAGDVLKQAEVDIGPSETVLSLNTKCLAAATETFPQLVQELTDGTYKRTPQDFEQRSYFGKFDRPAAACTIDWSATAERVEAFVRALTFGPYVNPVGVAKSFVSDAPQDPFVLTSVALAAHTGTSSDSGTVVEITDEAVVVATGEGHVAILRAQAQNGTELSPSRLAKDWGLAPGVRLGGPSSETGLRLAEADAVLSRQEEYWVERLAEAEPPELPQAVALADTLPDWVRHPLAMPASMVDRFGEDVPVACLLAFISYLAKTGRRERFAVSHPAEVTGLEGWYASHIPFVVSLNPTRSVRDEISLLREGLDALGARGGYLRDLVLRTPLLSGRPELLSDAPLPVGIDLQSLDGDDRHPGSLLSLHVSGDGGGAALAFNRSHFSAEAIDAMLSGVAACLDAACSDPERPWTELELLPASERLLQLDEWNRTGVDVPADSCVHRLFEDQVDRTPDDIALVFGTEEVTYRELDERANQLSHYLRDRGVASETLVGIHVDRSIDLLVATLGVMKAGGAYVPLDPDFPRERIAFMLEDSGAPVVVAHARLASSLTTTSATVVEIDSEWEAIASQPVTRPKAGAEPSNLAYAIYTSGSTGQPKGVLVEHRNVANFFTGMDAVVDHDPPGVWLAVTSLSFDISVLELFWTLARGFKVVVYKDPVRSMGAPSGLSGDPTVAGRPMDFGLFMWGNDDQPAPSKYELMLEAAKYFDRNAFDSVWTPERHFHAFGGPFPNPSVTGAAIAAVTTRVAIRSGSCVSPLHHPIRIAEEWAVVDNLSKGRVGLSFAAGWQPNDFVLRPENYPGNKQVMLEQIDTVRRLWRGEQIEFENPNGDMVAVTTLPRPVQAELPFWITTAGNPESYRQAGAMGANVLTHLLGQSLDEVAGKIAIYREARAEAGFDPMTGVVTLMLHTLVGEDDAEVREVVRQPMKDYLAASMKLVLGFAWSFPAFKRPGAPDADVADVDLSSLSEEEEEAILDFAFDRYYETSGLFGTPETCLRMVDRCKASGVNEIACLLDFGVATPVVLESLPYLKAVRDASNRHVSTVAENAPPNWFADHVRRHEVTHLQCTPSMARMLVDDPSARQAFLEIPHVMLGGEALPLGLAREVSAGGCRTLTNMYGPTETTIWSSTQRIESGEGPISIGRPIANTTMYILDRYRQPLPLGVPGDLYIGGDGVTRGYHESPELTAERFLLDPFRGGDERMYWTGDMARFRADGAIDFLGRLDQQIKIRGYRIELGEIEALLERDDAVQVAVVTLHESRPGDQRLVAYLVPRRDAPEPAALRDQLREVLPEYMVPSQFVTLDRVPLTPNGKIDRKALPSPEQVRAVATAEYVEPAGELEQTIALAWCSTLGVERVGVQDNFFDVGGHSLLVVQLHRTLREVVSQPLSLVDLYRFPTIRSLTDYLTTEGSDSTLETSTDRATKRKQAMAGMRRRRG